MPITQAEKMYLPSDVDPEDIPLCPCCDQPIFTYEPYYVAEGIDVICLVHQSCIDEESD